MRAVVFICSVVACSVALAEAHIGFEARIDTEWSCIRVDQFYAAGKARSAGFVPGDTIVLVDKVRVKHPKTISNYCKRKKPGDVVIVTVSRNGEQEPIEVELVDGDEMRKDGFLDW